VKLTVAAVIIVLCSQQLSITLRFYLHCLL